MGNQWSGLRDKAQLDWIRGANSKQKNTETMDTSVRLSKDQIAKISEYHQRFIKENNPTAVFFNLDDEFKVDQGYAIFTINFDLFESNILLIILNLRDQRI